MNWLVGIAEFLVNEVLSVPAFLIGIITAVGLAAMRKTVGQVVGGALKATLGFLLIGAGATLVTASLGPLGVMIQGAAGAQGVIPTNEAIVGIAQAQYGAQVAWLMILGFAISLVLARFTPLSYVFLTGHHILFMATLLTIVLSTAGYAPPVVVGFGGVLLGILMVSLPAFAHPWTRRITGDDSIAIGHFGTLGYVAAGATGRLVGGKSRSTEEMKVPESLRFLRDSMVATALSMVLMYLVVALIYLARAGEETAFAAFAASGGNPSSSVGNYLMSSVTQGLQFGVAVAVILFGVRTILGELVPAFQGIAAKVVPGAIPALDAPIVFPYAQNAGPDRLPVQLRRRAHRPRRPDRGSRAGLRPGPHPAGPGAPLLHGRRGGRLRQRDRRTPRRRAGRARQRPADHVPAGPAAEGAGRVRRREHDVRGHGLQLVRHPRRDVRGPRRRGGPRARRGDRRGAAVRGDPDAAEGRRDRVGPGARTRASRRVGARARAGRRGVRLREAVRQDPAAGGRAGSPAAARGVAGRRVRPGAGPRPCKSERMRPLRQNPCQSKCDWTPTGEVIGDDLVFACAGCGSEWTRQQGWTPRNLDGSIADAVAHEVTRP